MIFSSFYWSRIYQQLKKGEKYHELHRTVTINILKFKLLPQEDTHAVYGIYNMENGHRLTEDLEIHFLEIPKWKAKSVKEMKRIERWVAYFSNALDEQGLEELAMAEAGIRKALKAEHIFTQDDRNRRAYEQREAAIRDYESDMGASRREGREEGMRQGRQEGLAEGMEKGMEKGQLQNKLDTALEMLRDGMQYDLIAKYTKLSVEDIEKLAREHHLV